MPNSQITEVGPNHLRLTITIPKNEVDNLYKKQLNRYQQNANLKGFRKGKAPISYVQSLMGSDLLVRELINVFNTEADNYYKEHYKELFTVPLPIQETAVLSNDYKKIDDCSMEFDIINMPTLDLMNLPSGNIEVLNLELSDEEARRITNDILDRDKKWQETETVLSGDEQEQRVFFEGIEVKDDQPIEDGRKASFSMFNLDFTERFLETVKNAAVGATFRVDLREIEVDSDEQHVRSYYLHLGSDDGETSYIFDLTVKRIEGAAQYELNDESARILMGKEDATVEDLLALIKKNHEEGMKAEFIHIMNAQILTGYRDAALATFDEAGKNAIWASREEDEKNLTREEFDIRVANTIIKVNLNRIIDAKVTNSDILDAAVEQVMAQFGGNAQLPRQIFESYAQNMLKENKHFYERSYQSAYDNVTTLAAMDKLPIEKRTIAHTVAEYNEHVRRIIIESGFGSPEEMTESIAADTEVIAEEITGTAE